MHSLTCIYVLADEYLGPSNTNVRHFQRLLPYIGVWNVSILDQRREHAARHLHIIAH